MTIKTISLGYGIIFLGLIATICYAAFFKKTYPEQEEGNYDYQRIKHSIEAMEEVEEVNNIYASIRSFSDRYEDKIKTQELMRLALEKALSIEPISFLDNVR